MSPVKSSCQQSSIDTLAATKVFFSRNVKVSIFHVLYQSIAPHPIPMTLPNDIRHDDDDDDIPEISSQRTCPEPHNDLNLQNPCNPNRAYNSVSVKTTISLSLPSTPIQALSPTTLANTNKSTLHSSPKTTHPPCPSALPYLQPNIASRPSTPSAPSPAHPLASQQQTRHRLRPATCHRTRKKPARRRSQARTRSRALRCRRARRATTTLPSNPILRLRWTGRLGLEMSRGV